MLVTRIDKCNIHLVMNITKKNRKRDSEFLNALWQYVLFSKRISRRLPYCEICHIHGKFTFEGLGGIKKVGDGLMYIPINDNELYIVPDIIFHYFYTHKMLPTQKFKSAVLSGPKPESERYIEIVKPYYYTFDNDMGWRLVCSNCGKELKGNVIYSKGQSKSVAVYREPLLDILFPTIKVAKVNEFTILCYHCLHYQEVAL